MRRELVRTTGGALALAAGIGACDAQVDPGYQGEPLLTLKGRVEALQLSPPEADVGVLWLKSDAKNGCSGPVRSDIGFMTGSYSADADQECADACGPYYFGGVDGSFDPERDREWESCQRACGVDVTVETIVDYQPCVTGAVGQTAPVVGDFPAQFSLDMLLPPPAQAFMPSDTGERVALGYFVALAPHPGSLAVSFEDDPPGWLVGGSETHVLVYAADPVAAESSWGLYLGGSSYDVGYHLLRVQFGTRCGLPELDSDYLGPFNDDPDNVGLSGQELLPMPDMEPMMAPPADGGADDPDPYVEGAGGEQSPLPDYRGVPFVCGNGVCEAPEDCRHCSDCGACESGSPQSTGILYGSLGYACLSTPDTLVPAGPGSEGDIQLLLAPPELIDWPAL